MLVLSRKLNQNIVIDGRIIVKVVRVGRDIVKLGIEAPPDVPVHRQEVFDAIQKALQENPEGAGEKVPGSSQPAPPSKPENGR